MAIASSVLIGAGVAAAATAVGGAVAAGKQHKEMRRARNAKDRARIKLEDAVEARQDIINPYAGVTDLSTLASDLSAQISNPYNNLQVSTAAAEMQAEEADISLSNTLDTLLIANPYTFAIFLYSSLINFLPNAFFSAVVISL